LDFHIDLTVPGGLFQQGFGHRASAGISRANKDDLLRQLAHPPRPGIISDRKESDKSSFHHQDTKALRKQN
jgi:hypothetical protein